MPLLIVIMDFQSSCSSSSLTHFFCIFINQESPTEQVIVWDIHRTFPAHEYFKSSGGEGQEMLYKISKVSLAYFMHLSS